MRSFIIHKVFTLIIVINIVCDSASSANTDPNSMMRSNDYRDLSLLNNKSIMKIVRDIENLENDLEDTKTELSLAKAEIKTLKEEIKKLEKL